MQDKSLLEMLPIVLVQQVSSFLDYKSIVGASKASKTCQGLFNHGSIWKYQLKKDFGVENDPFSKFEKKIKVPNYKQLYVRFYYLSQQPNLAEFIKNIYRDKSQHNLVLLACADNITCLENLPREQQYIIAVLAIYAGCIKTPYSFLENHKDEKLLDNFLHHAIRSGNLQLVQYLLDSKNKFELTPEKDALNDAASSGNLQLVQYLLDDFNLTPDDDTLTCATESGNLQLMQYLLKRLELKPDNKILHSAACSGNLQLVQYLLNPVKLTPDHDTLHSAARSGNLQLVQYLLNSENKFELKPNYITLYCAAKSGNLPLMQYLLSPKNKFKLTPDKLELNAAAKSGNLQLVQYLLNQFHLKSDNILTHAVYGNLQLVQYLLNPANNFCLTPNDHTLTGAVSSGNLPLVQYLLNPVNQFGLEVTQKILDIATEKKNFVLAEYLLPSHFALQKALEKMKARDITAAETLLQQSHTACPSHYKMMLQYILDNPQRFSLNDEDTQCLKSKILPNPHFSKDGIKKTLEFNLN